MSIKLLGALSILGLSLQSCSPPKTVFITNNTGSSITLKIDSSYTNSEAFSFVDSLNGLTIKNKTKLNFGKGKWTKVDKSNLEELFKHTQITKEGSSNIAERPKEIKVSLISFNVEELWVRIK